MVEQGVIHGRFQVLHNDHMRYLLAGMERCTHLTVGITNPDPSLTKDDPADPSRSLPFSNPMTYLERHIMVHEALREAGVDPSRFAIVPFPINFPELYGNYVPLDATFFLTIYDNWGRRKLQQFRRLGLKTEVMREVPIEKKGLSASDIRQRMVEGRQWESSVPPSTKILVEKWRIPDRLRRMSEGADRAGFCLT